MPEGAQAMLKLAAPGGDAKRIAAELGCSRNPLRRCLRQGNWQPYKVQRRPAELRGLEQGLAQCFAQHRGNADVVRQKGSASTAWP